MTLGYCMELVDSIAPNGYDESIKKRWLSELDGRVRVELHDEAIDGVSDFGASTSTNTQLAAPFPFDQMYWMYLIAMLDLANGDTARYLNSATMFNSAYENYAKWLIRRR